MRRPPPINYYAEYQHTEYAMIALSRFTCPMIILATSLALVCGLTACTDQRRGKPNFYEPSGLATANTSRPIPPPTKSVAATESSDPADTSPLADPEEWFQRLLVDNAFVGSVTPGERAVRRISFENISDNLLLFEELGRSCSCVQIKLPDEPVYPGQPVEIVVTAFDPGPRLGRIRHWANVGIVLVDRHDPGGQESRAAMRVPIEFALADSVSAMPPRITVEVVAGDIITRRLYFRGNSEPSRRIANIRSDHPAIAIGKLNKHGDHAAFVDIRIDSGNFSSSVTHTVVVEFNDDKAQPPLQIPVAIRIFNSSAKP